MRGLPTVYALLNSVLTTFEVWSTWKVWATRKAWTAVYPGNEAEARHDDLNETSYTGCMYKENGNLTSARYFAQITWQINECNILYYDRSGLPLLNDTFFVPYEEKWTNTSSVKNRWKIAYFHREFCKKVSKFNAHYDPRLLLLHCFHKVVKPHWMKICAPLSGYLGRSL